MLNADTDDTEVVDDLSTLSWVHDELRRSLEGAHKSLRRYLKEAEALDGSDVAAVDPAVLRAARAQVHQGVGALEMIGLPGPARVLRATENVLQRFIARPKLLDAAAVETVESASFGVLDYLGRKLAGKGLPTLALFPQYLKLQQLAGADRVHPADLWRDDWAWCHVPADMAVAPRAADASVRREMEVLLLALMRAPDRAAMARLADLCASLGRGSEGHLAGLWQLAAAFFEAQATGLLEPDVFAKRVASRLLAQLRLAVAGQTEVSDRLAQDLLFFCAHARAPQEQRPAPRLAMVREAYNVDGSAAFDYGAVRLGRFDPALISQARKRVAGAKELWSAVAGGEAHRSSGLAEQFALVGDSLKRLYPSGEILADALQQAVAQTLSAGQAPAPALAMEVATGVLYLDASLEDGEFDHPLVAGRVQRLAQRIRQVGEGHDAQPLEPWMEELYRRVSDRQTMGSVVQELRAALSEVEKQIDQFFRDPSQREALLPVPGQLHAMRSVLTVLDLDHASQAVLRMRDDVETLRRAEIDPQRADHPELFDRLADNLGALSFMIDMLSVQPQTARALFRFDPEAGTLVALMGRRSRHLTAFGSFDAGGATPPPLVQQARSLASSDLSDDALRQDLQRLSQQALLADQPLLAEKVGSAKVALERATDETERQAVREELAQAVAELAGPAPAAEAVQQPVRITPESTDGTGLEDDAEMRDIFVEEAREVIAGAREAVSRLGAAGDDLGDLTVVRRAFHTLKGSARMIGLGEFGETAWSCEQLYNARLAEQPQMDAELQAFTMQALDALAGWVDAIVDGRGPGFDVPALAARADALRLGEAPIVRVQDDVALPAFEPVVPAAPSAAQATAELLQRVPDLPSVDDLRLDLDLPPLPDESRQAAAPAAAASGTVVDGPVDEMAMTEPMGFDLDFGPFDGRAADAPARGGAPAAVDRDADLLPEDLRLDFREAGDTTALAVELAEWPAATGEAATATELDAAAFDAAFGGADGSSGPEAMPPTAPMPLEDRTNPSPDAAAAAPAVDAGPAAAGEGGADVLAPEEDPVKVIGDLRIGIPLFNIFLNEADELSRRLCTALSEGLLDADRVPDEHMVALAHSLAGSSATVGYVELSALARSLEHLLARASADGRVQPGEAQLFSDVAEEIRHLLHQFAAGFLKVVSPALRQRLDRHEAAQGVPLAGEAMPVDATAALAGTLPPPGDEPPAAAPAPDAVPGVTTPEPTPEAALLPLPGDELGRPAVTEFHAEPLAAHGVPKPSADALDDEDDLDAVDNVDEELFPIFRDEGEELLPQLQGRMRDWARRPAEVGAASACMRTLHTFKGGARLAGAMRLGEMAHRLETAIEHLLAMGSPTTADVETLLARVDAIVAGFEQLGRPAGEPAAPVASPAAPLPAAHEVPLAAPVAPAAAIGSLEASAGAAQPAPLADGTIDWSRFSLGETLSLPAADKPAASSAAVRVRAPLLDRLVNQAGEVSITRARIETDVGQIRGSLGDLSENLDRLRRQLRDLELQAESQIASRIEAAKAAAQDFDPLEMDRFTRFQELTRMMAESVNDVATVQRGLQRSLQATEDELASQARLTRDLQDDLLRTRMVEFESMADRLYRVVRQAAKETGKQVRLDIVGGSIEVDRGVLDRMTGPFEHLLRNSVAHGIEPPAQREVAGKDATGTITIGLAQEGNEVAVEFRDDGAGLNLERIRERAVRQGLIGADAQPPEAELASLIFAPGFSTADSVSELAGRGVGMDVVRAEVNAMGGRIETATAAGLGASFRLVLPLTTAVTQVVMLRCGELRVAVPSTLVEEVKRVPADTIEQAYASGAFAAGERVLPFFWLGALLQAGARGDSTARTQPVVIIRSAAQRVALHVDEVIGNQEVVVKNLGPQLSRLPGLAGITLLPSGAVALIYNPVALATTYGEAAREQLRARPAVPEASEAPVETRPPLVLVVDDSLTVRRVTQRLLAREGYRVALAKDGLDALERLAEELPAVVLSDIEMPRMDGFDLVRQMRSDPRLTVLPVIMITSRIAQKHRDYAAELGVNHYLGKPYSEEELLSLVARYVREAAAA